MSDAHMTFGFSEEQRQMRASVLGLLNRVLPPAKIRELDKAGEYPFEAHKALADAGYMGLVYPTEYGGMGGSYMDLAVLGEALGYHYGGIAQAYGITVIYAGMHVALHGSEDMKREVLPKIISGDMRLALCLSEPNHGSDVAGIELAAVRDGNGYVLNGREDLQQRGARGAQPGRGGEDQAGPRLRRHQHVPGRHIPARRLHPPPECARPAHDRGQPLLLRQRAPSRRPHHRRGEQRLAGLMKCLNVERLNLAANGVGNTRRILDHVLDYAKTREQFGRPISKFQAVSHKLAEMEMMWQTARAQTFRVAQMLDAGLDPVCENAVAKAYATEVNWKVADMAMQIMAGAGYIMDQDMQMMFRDARVGMIGGGTSEIQRNVIARCMGL